MERNVLAVSPMQTMLNELNWQYGPSLLWLLVIIVVLTWPAFFHQSFTREGQFFLFSYFLIHIEITRECDGTRASYLRSERVIPEDVLGTFWTWLTGGDRVNHSFCRWQRGSHLSAHGEGVATWLSFTHYHTTWIAHGRTSVHLFR